MSISPFQARLEVFEASISYVKENRPDISWYNGSIKIAITPWVTTTIRDFFLEVTVNNKKERYELFMQSEDQYGTPISIKFGEGYNLNPDYPIGKHLFTFKVMTRAGETIDPNICVVLHVGIRNYKKCILAGII